MIVRELVTRLGFEFDQKNLVRFERSIDKFKKKIEGLNGALSITKKNIFTLTASATGLNVTSIKELRFFKNEPILLRPDLSKLSTNPINNKNTNNRITQNINIFVPAGTSQEQATVIIEQVAEAMQKQFDSNILRGMDYTLEG